MLMVSKTVYPQSSYRGVVAVSEEDAEKPLQHKLCKLLQPNVTTLIHVGGTLTCLNSPETETKSYTTLHVNFHVFAAALYVNLFTVGASGGPWRLKR